VKPWSSLLLGLVLLGGTLRSATAETVSVPAPSDYSYESDTVRQLQVHGQWGRYLSFQGRTLLQRPAVPARFDAGNPGTLNCSQGQCVRQGYVAPSWSAGTPERRENRNFVYELDCRDLTFNRRGDQGQGWLPSGDDPTAQAVARAYCPRLDSLPR
jgi:hypothetical protein